MSSLEYHTYTFIYYTFIVFEVISNTRKKEIIKIWRSRQREIFNFRAFAMPAKYLLKVSAISFSFFIIISPSVKIIACSLHLFENLDFTDFHNILQSLTLLSPCFENIPSLTYVKVLHNSFFVICIFQNFPRICYY